MIDDLSDPVVTNKTDILDLSYLHITGQFDNCLGSGQFLRIFSCVATYCMGTGWH